MSHDAHRATDVFGAIGSISTTDVLGATGRNALVMPAVSNVAERPAAMARSPAGQEAQEDDPIAACAIGMKALQQRGMQVLQCMLTDASAPVQLVQVPKMSIGIRVANTGIMVGWFPVDPTIALRKLLLDYCALCSFHPAQVQFHWHVDGQQILLNSSALELGLVSGDILDVVFLSMLFHWRDFSAEPDPETDPEPAQRDFPAEPDLETVPLDLDIILFQ